MKWNRLSLCGVIVATALCSWQSVETAMATPGPFLWVDDSAGNIGKVDVHTGSVNLIGNAGVALTDIAFDPTGNLWGIDFNTLYRVNSTTGVATPVGSTGISVGNALVFGSNGTLYAAGGGTTQLYTVNTVTGAATSIGTVGFPSAGDLAFNQGTLYMSDLNNKLVRISLGPTVSGIEVGPFGFNNVYGMATGDDGVLYGVAGTQVFSTNPATGQGSLTANYSGHGLFGANGTAFISEATPEPTTAALMCLGAMAFLRGRFRIKRDTKP